MQRWEYFTATFEANIQEFPGPPRDDIPPGDPAKYSVRSLMPQLNDLGDQGWELMSIEPVNLGKKGDVIVPTAAGHWGHHYFCCFKRPGLTD